ncbi:hypothetical protein SFRURICE_013974, partial [Spodoptera frugiperda]
MPSRRRDSTDKSVQDIITFMKATNPNDVPNCRLSWRRRYTCCRPSLLTTLAQVQCKLETSDATIQELRAEIVLLRNVVPESRSQGETNVNTHRGAQNVSVSCFESAKLNSSPIANNEADAPCLAAPRVPPRYTNLWGSGTIHTTPRFNRIPVQRCPEKPECDEDGFIKVPEKKKKNPTSRNQCGTGLTGHNMLLRPAVPTTLLYVSRLRHSTM